MFVKLPENLWELFIYKNFVSVCISISSVVIFPFWYPLLLIEASFRLPNFEEAWVHLPSNFKKA